MNRKEQKLFSWKGDIDTVCSFVEATNYLKRLLHGAMVAMEPETGAIRAYVGGLDFNHFKLGMWENNFYEEYVNELGKGHYK